MFIKNMIASIGYKLNSVIIVFRSLKSNGFQRNITIAKLML